MLALRSRPARVLLALLVTGLVAATAVSAAARSPRDPGAPPAAAQDDRALAAAGAELTALVLGRPGATADRPPVPGTGGQPAPVPPVPPADAPAPAQPRAPGAPRTSVPWTVEVSARTDVPARALRAYADATLATDVETPGCGLGWTTLAAIGAVESGHGTFGGATLLDDGRPSRPVVGPALDGRPGLAALPADPGGTAWHADPVWDHAVGPLQFLPSTWQRWAADGDDDGVADPHDLDDAALAAARYLCAGGRDMTGASGWRAAVLSYNRSDEYAAQVLAQAEAYARRSTAATEAP